MLAGHRGDVAAAREGLFDPSPGVRAVALSALARAGDLRTADVEDALASPDAGLRRRAAELAAARPEVRLVTHLGDAEATVVEVVAWALGEQGLPEDDEEAAGAVDALARVATGHPDPLCREAAVAALGALGHQRGLPAILAATVDRATVRRRAVLALAPFAGPEVDAAVEQALADRDWQVRQAAEDVRSP